jgi:hypothetical protein
MQTTGGLNIHWTYNILTISGENLPGRDWWPASWGDKKLHGKLHVLKNDPHELVRRYREDFPIF